MSIDTEIGGPDGAFPVTRWSVVRRAGRETPEARAALEDLCRRYWKPIYVFIRSVRRVGGAQAEDLTQDFLVEMVEGGLLGRFRPDRASFRAYLKGAVRLFLFEANRREHTARRGGDRRTLSLDANDATLLDSLVATTDRTPEDLFDLQWTRALLDDAVARLEAELASSENATRFEVLRLYDLEPAAGERITYAEVARRLDLKETDVTNHLHKARRRLRELLRERIADYVDVEGEIAVEFRDLFGG